MAAQGECGTCRANRGELPAPGGVIYEDGLWRLEHSFEPIPLVGWLVLKPLRHVEFFGDLTAEEAESFGRVLRRVSHAMQQVLRPAKIYVCQFSEAEGLSHIHFHLIPRIADTALELRGPRIFGLLATAVGEGRNLGDIDAAARVAKSVRELLEADTAGGP